MHYSCTCSVDADIHVPNRCVREQCSTMVLVLTYNVHATNDDTHPLHVDPLTYAVQSHDVFLVLHSLSLRCLPSVLLPRIDPLSHHCTQHNTMQHTPTYAVTTLNSNHNDMNYTYIYVHVGDGRSPLCKSIILCSSYFRFYTIYHW